MRRPIVDVDLLVDVAGIIEDVRVRGEPALREFAERAGDVLPDDPLWLSQSDLLDSLLQADPQEVEVLERIAEKIRDFAFSQLDCLPNVTLEIDGGQCGHRVRPVARAGCCAFGTQALSPTSVLSCTLTADVAGVPEIWLSCSRPTVSMKVAAAIAGVDGLLCTGGAHAVAALAFGAGSIPACDAIVGPTDEYGAAAKNLVARTVSVDSIDPSSELVIVCDRNADPGLVAADLLAMAELNSAGIPVLISADAGLAERVEAKIVQQLSHLNARHDLTRVIDQGYCVIVNSVEEGLALCDRLAPQQAQLHLVDAGSWINHITNVGHLGVGKYSPHVLARFGAGPNGLGPSGGSARSYGGLSVMSFLRVHTWLEIEEPESASELIEDVAELARLEHLDASARSALMRLDGDPG